jgi:hypothetical protein
MTTEELFLSLVAALGFSLVAAIGALSVLAFLYCIHQLFKEEWQAAEDRAKQRREAHAAWKARRGVATRQRAGIAKHLGGNHD